MTVHLMIDLETLGVGPSAPLFQIGACLFSEDEIIADAGWNVDLLDVLLSTGRAVQPETLEWWRTQKRPDRSNVVCLSTALSGLSRMVHESGLDFIWANSPSFDLVILEGHFRSLGAEPFWSFRQELDMRTLKWMNPERYASAKQKIGNNTGLHDARADARWQAEIVRSMLFYA